MSPSSKRPLRIKEFIEALSAIKPPQRCPDCGSLFESIYASFVSFGDEEGYTVALPICVECEARKVVELPEYVAISPTGITCPRCKAEPGKVCEVLLGDGLEVVHVERIKLAAALDVSAKEFSDEQARNPNKPSQ
jgi:hypothetical protein